MEQPRDIYSSVQGTTMPDARRGVDLQVQPTAAHVADEIRANLEEMSAQRAELVGRLDDLNMRIAMAEAAYNASQQSSPKVSSF